MMGKVRPAYKTRSSATRSPLGRSCRCRLHDVWCSVGNYRLYVKTSHDYQKSDREWLIENSFLSQNDSYFCSECLQHANQQLKAKKARKDSSNKEQLPTRDLNEEIHSDTDKKEWRTPIQSTSGADNREVNELIQVIKSGSLSDTDLSKLCLAIGQSLSRVVYEDTVKLLGQFKKLEVTHATDCITYIRSRCSPLVAFLEGVTDTEVSNDDDRRNYILCLALEQIYLLRNLRFVGPLSFAQGLLQWTLSGSKVAHTLAGGTTPMGSITTLKTALKELAKLKNECFDRTIDMEVHADNTQRTQKTGRVRENGTTPLGVATNVVFIKCNSSSTANIQTREDLKPSKWQGKSSRESLKDKIDGLENELNENVFRPYRAKSLSGFFKTMVGEIDNDHVSVRMENEDKIVCPSCCGKFDQTFKVCPQCGHNRENAGGSNRYSEIPHGFPEEKCCVKLGEIIGVNPNSKETIKTVLEDIQLQAKVGTDRAWVRVGFDGVPVRIAAEIIERTVICTHCGMEYDISKTTVEEHLSNNCASVTADDVTGVHYEMKFEGIFLVPGAGHTEKNFILALFSLLRHVMIEKVADLLGFRSKNAKKFIVGCSNHHVSWQILTIIFEAFAMELLYVYQCEASKSGREISMLDFSVWKDTVVNPNYNFLYDLVFSCILGLICFRSGVRRNNSMHLLAGRQKIAPIMYLGKHAIYQNIIFRDMATRVEAPQEISEFIMQNESFSRSGDHSSGEGGDYVVENENRALKSNLPPGAPTVANWQLASRCHEVLVANRENVFRKAGVRDTALSSSSVFKFENEVQMLRAFIRDSGMLCCPSEERLLVSLEGTPLHPDLVNFYHVAVDNYNRYKIDPESELSPVFVTHQDEVEFNDVNNWTVAKIQAEARETISRFPDLSKAEFYSDMMKTRSRAKKIEQISLLRAVQEELEQQLSDVDSSAFDDDTVKCIEKFGKDSHSVELDCIENQ